MSTVYQVNSTDGLTLRLSGSTITFPDGATFADLGNSPDVAYYFAKGKLKLVTSSTSNGNSGITVSGTISGAAGGPPGPIGPTGAPGVTGPPGPTNTDPAESLATSGAAVDVSAASPPTSGQVLKATGATTATWQTLTLGTTLDGAYDFGGSGAGRAITADSGSVSITNDGANNTAALTLSKSPSGTQTSSALVITAANCDYGLRIDGASSLTGGLIVNASTISCPGTVGTLGERFGAGSAVSANNGTAFGAAASVSAAGGSAFGKSAAVTAANGTALGFGASAGHAAIALGVSATTSAANQVAIGSDTTPLTTIAFGRGPVSTTAITAVTLKGTDGSGAGIAGAGLTLATGISGDAATASGDMLFKVANTGAGTSSVTALRINGTDSYVAVGTSAPTSQLHVFGSTARLMASVSSNTAAGNVSTYLADSTAGTIAITLPTAASCPGRVYTVKKIVAGNTVNVTPNGAELIDGSNSPQALTSQWSKVTVQSNGTSWFTI